MKQSNAFTKLAYQGKNQVELELSKEKNNYKSNEWLTFLQAKQLGLKIKKGEHTSASVFKGFSRVIEDDEERSIPLGFAKLFNLDQTEKINE